MNATKIAVCILLVLSGRAAPETKNTKASMNELLELLRTDQIVRLEILHVPGDLETLVNITPQSIRSLGNQKVIFEESRVSMQESSLLAALKEIEGSNPGRIGDMRWAILFFDKAGKERSAIFLNRWGKLGIFQGLPLSLNGNCWAGFKVQSVKLF